MLTDRLVRIARTRRDQGGEIFDLDDLVFGKKKCAELIDIEPSMGRLSQCAVVEIESVDLDDRDQVHPLEMQKPPRGGFAPGHRSGRGDVVPV